MSRRRELTRRELIGGMLATGALAACAPGSTPVSSTFAPRCVAATQPVGLEEIFSDPAFANLDKAALARAFDTSAQLQAVSQGYGAQTAGRPQVGTAIQTIPGSGIVIQTPGTYALGGNLSWTPSGAQRAAITILCSDVTLDLGGYTLTVVAPDPSLQISGIAVLGSQMQALTGVTVTNGTVANAPEHGILATSVCGLSISNVTVTGIGMRNLSSPFLTPAGIKVQACIDVALSGCTVSAMNVTTASCAGIFLLKTVKATVNGCRASSLTNNDGAVQGFSYISCMNVTTANCTADTLQSHNNGNTNTSGHTVLGFCPIACWNLTYTDCAASYLTGCCDDCHGMSVFLDGAVTVTRFRADHVVDGVTPANTGAKATGLEVYGVGVRVTDSVVSFIHAINPQDLQSTGFSAWGLGIAFERCRASNVTVQKDLTPDAFGAGFGWAPDPRFIFCYIGAMNVTYTDCTADTCDVGFDTWYHVDSTWVRPVETHCTVGILVQPGGKRQLSCNPCSECVAPPTPPETVTLTNIASGNTYPG